MKKLENLLVLGLTRLVLSLPKLDQIFIWTNLPYINSGDIKWKHELNCVLQAIIAISGDMKKVIGDLLKDSIVFLSNYNQ